MPQWSRVRGWRRDSAYHHNGRAIPSELISRVMYSLRWREGAVLADGTVVMERHWQTITTQVLCLLNLPSE